ncbi:hypothetical protein B0H19DRAFT_1277240 [Mycena capillaripes]|nr:hypothetical protein B0H19DRAFT_1277240 [Mycena capillaripes]
MSFAAYTHPHPQTHFSVEYFAGLTVANATYLVENDQLPRILPKDSVKKWVFDQTVPTSISEIILGIDEEIPCLDDILPITQAVEQAFCQEGARSVCVQIGQRIVRYHLSKIHLILGVNNQTYNLEAAASILQKVTSGSQGALLLPELIEQLKLNKYAEPLAGFHVTQTPLYTLGCLLNEQWAMEDVLNARAEFIYFRRAAMDLGAEPSFLFLPTSFMNDCRKLVALPHAPYSSEIIRLRGRIRSGNVSEIGFVPWTGDHYGAIYKLKLVDLENGDSLHLPAAQDTLPILRWAFAGLGDFEPPPSQSYIQPGLMDRQSTMAGGGSCGIASTNFVEFRLGLDSPRWRASQSADFRDLFLQEIILYHLLARRKTTAYTDWVIPCTLVENGEVPMLIGNAAVGYRDYNLHMLSHTFEHPIFDWCGAIGEQPAIFEKETLSVSNPSTSLPSATCGKPTVSASAGLSNHSGGQPPSLTAAFELGARTTVPPISELKEISLDSGFHIYSNFSTPSAHNLQNPPPSSASKNDAAIIIFPDTPPPRAAVVVNLADSPLPKTPPRLVKQELIDICSPDVIDLCTPPRLATKKEITDLMSPFRPSVKRKHVLPSSEKPVIDLTVSRPPHRKPKIESALSEFKTKSTSLSLPNASANQARQFVVAFGPIKVGNIYPSFHAGMAAVLEAQAALGHKFIKGQSIKDDNGVLRRQTLRCNRYRNPKETHRSDIDPSDYRKGKSGRTDCHAHVNLVRVLGPQVFWHISVVDASHNHAPHVPPGGPIQRPPTAAQRSVVAEFAEDFSRAQLKKVLKSQFPGNKLENRQISNMANESLFKPILDLLNLYTAAFAIQTCFKQMELAMFYDAAALQRPEGVRNWSEYAIAANDSEPGFQWQNNEEQRRNHFSNDRAYIGTRFLLRLVQEQGLVPSHLLKITHTETRATHLLALFPDGRYLSWVKISGLPFNISLIRPRWYLDPALNVKETETVALKKQTSHIIHFTATSLPSPLIVNPVSSRALIARNATPPPPTRTISERAVYAAVTADVRSMITGVQTEEQLNNLLERLDAAGRAPQEEAMRDSICDPPTVKAEPGEEEQGFRF